MIAHLNIKPVRGKWYVSEGARVGRGPGLESGIDYLGASKTLLSGPFSDKAAATECAVALFS